MAWKPVGNNRIREIIELINSEYVTPTELAKKMNVHEVTISRDISILKKNNLIKEKKQGTQRFYTLNKSEWKKHVEATMYLGGKNFVSNFEKNIQKKYNVDSVNNEIRRGKK